jgi:hypothetical protein
MGTGSALSLKPMHFEICCGNWILSYLVEFANFLHKIGFG